MHEAHLPNSVTVLFTEKLDANKRNKYGYTKINTIQISTGQKSVSHRLYGKCARPSLCIK